jgi:hypothetical protein
VSGPVLMTSRATPRPRPGSVTNPAPTRISAVDRLGRRLRALTPATPHSYSVTDLSAEVGAGSTDGPAWIPVTEALEAMLAGAGEHLSASPAVTGARVIGSLGYAAAGRLAVALSVTGQAYDTGPDSLAVRLDDAGLIERIGVHSPTVAIPASEATPGLAPVIRLRDRAAVIGWAAERAWTTLDPLITELHRATRYGRVPMWNLVADSVLGPATVAPRLAGLDQRAGRATGNAFLDALVDLGAPIHRRGTLRPSSGPDLLIPVRGSCCLVFRQSREKCESCPLTSG